jgi:hypothetical protein
MGTKTPLFVRKQSGGMFTVVDETMTTGDIWFVDSGSATGADGDGYGQNPDAPFLTIDYAIGKAGINNGDMIFVMPGHAETVGATDITMDRAGQSIIGLGQGADRPTITLSAVGSTIAMDAASCRLKNLLVTITDDATVVIDINAADCIVEDCELRFGSGKEFVTGIDINGGGANVCDRTTIRGCKIMSTASSGSTAGIELGEVADDVLIQGCDIRGDFSSAAIHNPTGKVLTNLRISDCLLDNQQTGDHALELVSACTGVLSYNLYVSDLAQATGADTGSCMSYQCFHTDLIDLSAVPSPVIT